MYLFSFACHVACILPAYRCVACIYILVYMLTIPISVHPYWEQMKAQVVPEPDLPIVPSFSATPSSDTPSTSAAASPPPQACSGGGMVLGPDVPSGTPLFKALSMRKMRVEANITEIITDYFETRMPVVEGESVEGEGLNGELWWR